MKKKTIGLTYDLKTDYVFKKNDPPDANAEFDHPLTIEVIKEELEKRGNKVIKIGNANNLLDKLDRLSVDIVFNISEGLSGRNRESQVPIILEMMGIPFVGSDGLTLSLTLDKIMAKKILLSEDIPTPRFFEAKSSQEINDLDHLKFPLIVKPRYEGSSKGLSDKSKVENIDQLKTQVDFIVNTYHQSALVEEFISGSEYTVAIIGNDTPTVLPIVQIKIDGRLNLGERFYTFARITSDRLEYICPARITKELKKQISDYALKAYKGVECYDFGRVDIRVDERGHPFVLEVNPLPSLSTEDVFSVIANCLGISYGDILSRILDAALVRCGLN